MKVLTSGEQLEGKVIKYCNLINDADGNEHNIIATTDNEIYMFNVSYQSGHIKSFNEQQIKKSILAYKGIRNEFLTNEIITQEEVDDIIKENQEVINKRDEKLRQERYNKYLELKNEFEV